MKPALLLLVSAIAAAMLSGCGQQSPSASDVRGQLESEIGKSSSGLIRLVAFEKTNGITRDVMGVKVYEMEFTAEIEFLDDCMWGDGGPIWGGSFAATRGIPGKDSEYFALMMGKRKATKGQRQRFSGTSALEKSEKGWRVISRNVALTVSATGATPSAPENKGGNKPTSSGSGRAVVDRERDASNLREVVAAAMIYSQDNQDRLPDLLIAADGHAGGREQATIHTVAGLLARRGILTDARHWFSAADLDQFASSNDLKKLDRVLDPSRTALDPTFASQKVVAWDFATGLRASMPDSTPVAWTRGLRSDGSWDPKSSIYGGAGGYIAFPYGKVKFFSDLKTTPLVLPDGRTTSNILEALPAKARVVGSGPGTLHGAMGLGK